MSRLLNSMNKQKNIAGFHFRNDIIFIAALLLMAAAGLVYLFVFRDSGNVVEVTVDGEVYGVYSLSENITCEIRTGKNDENINRFVIADGKVYMQDASCPDGICVDHRPIFRDGESIVCLPNRVVVTVITQETEDSADIVV